MTQTRTFDEALVAEYYRHGLSVTEPRGKCRFSDTMVCAEHDGVPYCMDDHGRGDLMHGIRHRELMIARHHETIRHIYEYCVGLNVGDIWVLCGGGGQLQAFFGNRTGYLAILYLDMEDPQEAIDEEYLQACGNTPLTLQVNRIKNDRLFEHRFEMPGIELRTSRETFGNI